MQATDLAGRLEIRGFNPKMAGVYTCTAVGYEQFEQSQVSIILSIFIVAQLL